MKLLKLGMVSAVAAGAVMAMVMATTEAALAAARMGCTHADDHAEPRPHRPDVV